MTRVTVGTGVVWATPVVTSFGLTPAAAASGAPTTMTLQRPLPNQNWGTSPFLGATPIDSICVDFGGATGPTAQMLALNSDPNSSVNWQSLDFAMYFVQFTGGLTMFIYESGAFQATIGPVTAGDQMCIERSPAGVVTYTLNGTLVFTSGTTSMAPLFLDSSFWSQNTGFWSTGASTWTVTAC